MMNKLLLSLVVILSICTVVYTQGTLHLQSESAWYISSRFKKVDDKSNTHLFCIAASVSPKDDLKYSASLDVEVDDEYPADITVEDYINKKIQVKFSWQQNEENIPSIPYAGRASVNVVLKNNDGVLLNGWQDDEFKAKGILYGYLTFTSKTAKPKMISFNVADTVGPSGFNKIEGSIETCKQLLKIPATAIDTGDHKDDTETDNNDPKWETNTNTTKIISKLYYFKWLFIAGAALLVVIIVAAIRRCVAGCRHRKAACQNYQEMQQVAKPVDPIATTTTTTTTTTPSSTPFTYFMAPQSGMTPMYLQPTSSEGQPMQVMFIPQEHFQQFQEQMNQQKN